MKKFIIGCLTIATLSYLTAAIIFFSTDVMAAPAKVTVDLAENVDSIDGVTEINISTSSADIKIKTGSGEGVSVTLTGEVKGGSGVETPELIVEKEGDVLVVKTVRKKKMGFTFGYRSTQLKMTVTIPESYSENLSISSSSGDIKSVPLTLKHFSATTSSGDHFFEEIKCSSGEWVASSGDISLKHCEAGEFKTTTSSGDIQLSGISGDKLSLNTSSGEITGSELSFKSIKTGASSGDINLRSITGDTTCRTSSGEVSLAVVSFNTLLDISTSSGDISLTVPEGLSHSFSARTSGDISYNYEGNTIETEKKLDIECENCGKIIKARASSGEISIN